MVLPLRFPPGMAGGLLLAYPRMKKAGGQIFLLSGGRIYDSFFFFLRFFSGCRVSTR